MAGETDESRVMALLKAGARFGVNMDAIDLSVLFGGVITLANTGRIYADGAIGDRVALFGNFSFDGAGRLAGGELNHIQENLSGYLHFDVSGFFASATRIVGLAADGDMPTAFRIILNGDDSLIGASFDDLLRGHDGDDTIDGGGGYDTIYGGAGNDVVVGGTNHGPGDSYLRGDAGDDSIVGGIRFDDINGNVGTDTIRGREGDDWVVGGQDGDRLYGDQGADQVYGNMGDDTGFGGEGADTLRGGQGSDVLSGEDGDDFISGDRGSDTVAGGSGADIFNTFVGAGIDRVLDFNAGEGDRVRVEGGAPYTVNQVGADLLVNLGGPDVVILVGVQLSALPAGWIFSA